MSRFIDDPRLTAYALGELPIAEAEAFAAEIQDDPVALAEVEMIQAQGGELSEMLGGGAPALTELQRTVITQAAEKPAPRNPAWMMRAAVILGIAVALALVPLWQGTESSSRDGAAPTEVGHISGVSFSGEVTDHDVAVDLDDPGRLRIDQARSATKPEKVVIPPTTTDTPKKPAGDMSGFSLPRATLRNSGEGDGHFDTELEMSEARPHPGQRKPTDPAPPAPAQPDMPQVYPVTPSPLPRTGPDLPAPPTSPGPASPGATPRIVNGAVGAPTPSGRGIPAGPVTGGPEGAKAWREALRAAEQAQGRILRLADIPAGSRAYYIKALKLPANAVAGVYFRIDQRTGKPIRVTGPESEQYDQNGDNPFQLTKRVHTSTFGLDVDTASYANVRRFLTHQGVLPPPGAVRIEELVNYFTYAYEAPGADAKHPFATHVQISSCPWSSKHLLARVAVKGKEVKAADRPGANLVFLVDVSGSMKPQNKLPLVKQGLRLLLEKLDERDKVAIVTYAGSAGVALASTSCAEKETIAKAIDALQAGGSTNGEAGIQLAYRIAKENFIKGGLNRVMLATDGDFNTGQTSRGVLVQQIKSGAANGTYLTVLGFGMGNYKDGRLEAISNHGNGTYAYIDSLAEVKKVLVEGLTGQLVPIAKDVKIQVFFNPRTVRAYRLIGYENRMLAAKDFNDDTKDAGDVGAGHTVTAFYELVPVGQPLPGATVDPNPFVNSAKPKEPETPKDAVEHATALFQLRLRYKQPDGDESTLIEQMIEPSNTGFDKADEDFRFAAAVASFGMKLRRSKHQGRMSWDAIVEVAESAVGEDPHGRRSEFLVLVRKARELLGQ